MTEDYARGGQRQDDDNRERKMREEEGRGGTRKDPNGKRKVTAKGAGCGKA